MALADRLMGAPGLTDGGSRDVYDRIYESILEHRLRPGTKLPEEKLAAIFDVSRARIRKVLARLEHEQLVDVYPNRGAYIARPTIEQSADIFEARRVVEPAVLRRLAKRTTDKDVVLLRSHVDSELAARARDDKRAIIRLSGEFHNLTADLAGNSSLTRSMRELSALTCLTILLYDAPTAVACLPDDHAEIAEALGARDGEMAADIVTRHLNDIERSVVFDKDEGDVDLESIFSM
jgi:DNA-binding GntR family transcriptional regulator